MFVSRTIVGAALALAGAAPAAQAADNSVIATTARPTPLAAGGGHVLYSAWDGSAYRLTEAGHGALPIEGSARPFHADIGRDSDDHVVAVYPRCKDGDTGCDLYRYDFETAREHELRGANSSGNDEVGGAVWRDRLVFARLYARKGKPAKGVLYQRSLAHPHRRSERIGVQRAYTVDVRGTRVPFADVREWSREPWLAWTSHDDVSRLTRVPGSGAAVDFLDAMNPTAYGNSIYWLLVRDGESNVSVLHRYNRSRHRDERVKTSISGVASGFAWDAHDAYYAVPAHPTPAGCLPQHDCPTAIHRVSDPSFEKAPKIELH
jgi:hypothetical protein